MRTRSAFVVVVVGILIAACSDPRNTKLPVTLDKIETIRPQIEKLDSQEKELLAAYMMRHTVGAAMGSLFGGQPGPAGIPEGVTIGKAIDEQREFAASRATEEARQAELKKKLLAEQEAAMAKMRDAVTVTLVEKSVQEEHGASGMVLDEKLTVRFGYKNNTDKDIAGVKGTVDVKDLFGDQLAGFNISNDETIPAGKSITWVGGRSVKYSLGANKDRKFAGLSEDKFKVVWNPQTIIFSDGTKLTRPE